MHKEQFDAARTLIHLINNGFRTSYNTLVSSTNVVDRQKATAAYFIDRFGFRIGGERDGFLGIGRRSLCCEHLKLSPQNIVHVSFLGMNSTRYETQ